MEAKRAIQDCLNRVRIKCPYPVKYITGLIVRRVNEHSKAITAWVLHEDERNFCIESVTSNDGMVLGS